MELFFKFTDLEALYGDKKNQELLKPKRCSKLAAGLDLIAANKLSFTLKSGCFTIVPTGIAIALPSGFEGQIRPRSGLAAKYGITVLNSPGTIDADYRGEIKVVLINHGSINFKIKRGMRIAQLIISPIIHVELKLQTKLNDTLRNKKGFGSTGGIV